MTNKTSSQGASKGPVILTIILLAIVAFIFMISFVVSSTTANNAPSTVTEDTYRTEVDTALRGADPVIGKQLIEDHNCVVCHVHGNGTVAPLFVGIANRAGESHLPLGTEQYLYESIIHPGAFLVDEYANSMPNNYNELLSEQEIGHIIAYLMTLTDNS